MAIFSVNHSQILALKRLCEIYDVLFHIRDVGVKIYKILQTMWPGKIPYTKCPYF